MKVLLCLALLLTGCAHTPPAPGPALERDLTTGFGEFPHRRALVMVLETPAARQLPDGTTLEPGGRVAAHMTLPLGSWLMLRNPKNGRTLLVAIRDRGPFRPGFDLALTPEAFNHLFSPDTITAPYEVLEVWLPRL